MQQLASSSQRATLSAGRLRGELLPFRRGRVVRSQTGVRPSEPFSENAAQVKRLINRDRKEFLGNTNGDILDKYQTEFGTEGGSNAAANSVAESTTQSAASSNPFSSPAQPAANPFGSSAASSSSNPFGAPSASNPFGSAVPTQRTKSAIEPAGLRPDMSPDPIVQEKAFNLLENITITQVVLFFSFTTIIGIMIATAYFVFSVGGIRLNGV